MRDQRDAKVLRLLRMTNVAPFAVDAHDAPIGLMHAGEDLDQRALARAILPANGADLAAAKRKRDILQHFDRAEALGYRPRRRR